MTDRMTSREHAFWAKVEKTDDCWLWTGARVRGCRECRRAWNRAYYARRKAA